MNLKKEFIIPKQFFVPEKDKQQIKLTKDTKEK